MSDCQITVSYTHLEALNLTLAMPHLIDEALAMQKKAAVAADATDYMEILHL